MLVIAWQELTRRQLMAKAGFDPRAALQLWEILNEVEADTQEALGPRERAEQIALLRTHPTGEERLVVRPLARWSGADSRLGDRGAPAGSTEAVQEGQVGPAGEAGGGGAERCAAGADERRGGGSVNRQECRASEQHVVNRSVCQS